MVYIVTGHPRSGTSMMMAALNAGGIKAIGNEDRDKKLNNINPQYSGFNATGLWELSVPEFNKLGEKFPSCFDGCCVKLVWAWLKYMKPYKQGYGVICMRRDPEEVRQSYEASIHDIRTNIHKTYEGKANKIYRYLKSREDVNILMEVNYRDAVFYPLNTFEYIKNSGFPLDAEKASSIIRTDLYRFRLNETITMGA